MKTGFPPPVKHDLAIFRIYFILPQTFVNRKIKIDLNYNKLKSLKVVNNTEKLGE